MPFIKQKSDAVYVRLLPVAIDSSSLPVPNLTIEVSSAKQVIVNKNISTQYNIRVKALI